MPFKCNYCFCCLQFRLEGTTTRKHNLNLKCMKVWINFASKVSEGNTCFAKKFTEVQYIKRAFRLILVCMCILMCMCMCNVYAQYCTCMAQVSGLSCGCCPCPRPGSPSATITFLPCLPGTMLRAPLMSAAPASVQCSHHQLPAGRPNFNSLLSLSMLFMVFQTILGQWPWQTAAAALVPTGHTKLYSSQLVSLSLWLNSWCMVCGEPPFFLRSIIAYPLLWYLAPSGDFTPRCPSSWKLYNKKYMTKVDIRKHLKN